MRIYKKGLTQYERARVHRLPKGQELIKFYQQEYKNSEALITGLENIISHTAPSNVNKEEESFDSPPARQEFKYTGRISSFSETLSDSKKLSPLHQGFRLTATGHGININLLESLSHSIYLAEKSEENKEKIYHHLKAILCKKLKSNNLKADFEKLQEALIEVRTQLKRKKEGANNTWKSTLKKDEDYSEREIQLIRAKSQFQSITTLEQLRDFASPAPLNSGISYAVRDYIKHREKETKKVFQMRNAPALESDLDLKKNAILLKEEKSPTHLYTNISESIKNNPGASKKLCFKVRNPQDRIAIFKYTNATIIFECKEKKFQYSIIAEDSEEIKKELERTFIEKVYNKSEEIFRDNVKVNACDHKKDTNISKGNPACVCFRTYNHGIKKQFDLTEEETRIVEEACSIHGSIKHQKPKKPTNGNNLDKIKPKLKDIEIEKHILIQHYKAGIPGREDSYYAFACVLPEGTEICIIPGKLLENCSKDARVPNVIQNQIYNDFRGKFKNKNSFLKKVKIMKAKPFHKLSLTPEEYKKLPLENQCLLAIRAYANPLEVDKHNIHEHHEKIGKNCVRVIQYLGYVKKIEESLESFFKDPKKDLFLQLCKNIANAQEECIDFYTTLFSEIADIEALEENLTQFNSTLNQHSSFGKIPENFEEGLKVLEKAMGKAKSKEQLDIKLSSTLKHFYEMLGIEKEVETIIEKHDSEFVSDAKKDYDNILNPGITSPTNQFAEKTSSNSKKKEEEVVEGEGETLDVAVEQKKNEKKRKSLTLEKIEEIGRLRNLFELLKSLDSYRKNIFTKENQSIDHDAFFSAIIAFSNYYKALPQELYQHLRSTEEYGLLHTGIDSFETLFSSLRNKLVHPAKNIHRLKCYETIGSNQELLKKAAGDFNEIVKKLQHLKENFLPSESNISSEKESPTFSECLQKTFSSYHSTPQSKKVDNLVKLYKEFCKGIKQYTHKFMKGKYAKFDESKLKDHEKTKTCIYYLNVKGEICLRIFHNEKQVEDHNLHELVKHNLNKNSQNSEEITEKAISDRLDKLFHPSSSTDDTINYILAKDTLFSPSPELANLLESHCKLLPGKLNKVSHLTLEQHIERMATLSSDIEEQKKIIEEQSDFSKKESKEVTIAKHKYNKLITQMSDPLNAIYLRDTDPIILPTVKIGSIRIDPSKNNNTVRNIPKKDCEKNDLTFVYTKSKVPIGVFRKNGEKIEYYDITNNEDQIKKLNKQLKVIEKTIRSSYNSSNLLILRSIHRKLSSLLHTLSLPTFPPFATYKGKLTDMQLPKTRGLYKKGYTSVYKQVSKLHLDESLISTKSIYHYGALLYCDIHSKKFESRQDLFGFYLHTHENSGHEIKLKFNEYMIDRGAIAHKHKEETPIKKMEEEEEDSSSSKRSLASQINIIGIFREKYKKFSEEILRDSDKEHKI